MPDEYVLTDSLDKLELGQQKQESDLRTIGYVPVSYTHLDVYKRQALDCESFGAEGITVHPRPDERHIRQRPSGGIRKVYFSLLSAAKEEKAENSNKSVD